jgi:Xaa-Pro aminopeptidase
VRDRLETGRRRARAATCSRASSRRSGGRRTVRLDQATGADALSRIVTEAPAARDARARSDRLMKAVKNAAEIAGARAAHCATARR